MSTIREIFLVLALLLLIGGAAGHRWVLTEQAKEQQVLQQQQEKFETRVAEAGKVLDRELKVKPFSGVIAPENLQDEPAGTRTAVKVECSDSFFCLPDGRVSDFRRLDNSIDSLLHLSGLKAFEEIFVHFRRTTQKTLLYSANQRFFQKMQKGFAQKSLLAGWLN